MRLEFRFTQYVRVVYDNESPDWNYQSRTLQIGLGQAPAVYGYSPVPVEKPNDYRCDEINWEQEYFELNDFDIRGVRDGLGHDRCVNFLFKADTALYNKKGFYSDNGRELLTMSGNKLQVLDWEIVNGIRYVKFLTLKENDTVSNLTHENSPHLVHRFEIVFADKKPDNSYITKTVPKINRNGYLYYYLVSKQGYGYMPERFVKPL